MTDDLITQCAAHGWTLTPDGYELTGNGADAYFRNAESVRVWLEKQGEPRMKQPPLRAPFPAFGGKSAIAPLVWDRFGIVDNFVEPFVNSAAVALAAPYIPTHETWNDLNGFVANFWRATAIDPNAVADAADYPINECDLHARHAWIVQRQQDLTDCLMGDPDYYDAKIAGWWLWGICQWIGSGWCSGEGPWRVDDDGRLVNSNNQVVWRKLPHLGDAGRGINRKLPHLGDAGRGINRKRPHLGDAGMGQCEEWTAHLRATIGALRDRMRRVRVCCGDWSRVCGPTPTVKLGLTAVFLDPPYQMGGRDDVYDQHDAHPDGRNSEVFYDVVKWAVANGNDPRMRIAVCGYAEAELFPALWDAVAWKARGGYGNQGNGRGRQNSNREMIWFSPHCLKPIEAFLRPIVAYESDWTGTLFEEDL